MTATEPRLQGRTRWSMAARCPRMAAYALLGEQPAPAEEKTKRYWHRGRLFGGLVADQFREKYGSENVIAEKAVPWPDPNLPLGYLHTDVYVRPERMAVEVKSSTSPAGLLEDAIVQVTGAVHFDEESDVGAVVTVDPVDLDERMIPVLPTTEMRAHVEEIAQQIVHAGRGGPLPPRVCEKPGDAFGKFCPFAATCFDGWTAPEPRPVDSPAVVALARELYAVKQAEREWASAHNEVELRRKEIQAQLSEHLEAGEYTVGGLLVKKTLVRGRVTFDIATMIQAGVISDTLVEPFKKVGRPSERWTVEQVGAPAPATDDFGDEAPW